MAAVNQKTSKSSSCLLTVSKSSPTGSSLSFSLSVFRKKLSIELSRSSQSWSLTLRSRWSLLEASSSLRLSKQTAPSEIVLLLSSNNLNRYILECYLTMIPPEDSRANWQKNKRNKRQKTTLIRNKDSIQYLTNQRNTMCSGVHWKSPYFCGYIISRN